MSSLRERREVYATAAWQKLRVKALKAAGWLCEACAAEGRTSAAEIVHHKQPWQAASGSDRQRLAFDFDNLACLCRECHGQAHTMREPNPWDGLVRQKLNEVTQ